MRSNSGTSPRKPDLDRGRGMRRRDLISWSRRTETGKFISTWLGVVGEKCDGF